MAKLEGVKTLDMVGGQITKVEYNGAVYEKVEGDAKAGDLLYITHTTSASDTLANEFYSVVDDPDDGGIAYIDEEGDECNVDGWNSPDSNVFRKVSESDLPTIEEVNAKVDSLAERVDALEGSKPVPTIKEGNRVKALTDGQFYDIKAGEVGTIERFSEYLKSKGDPYYIVVETEDTYDYFRPQDLELVTEDDEEAKRAAKLEAIGRKPGEIKKGDIVRTKFYGLLEVDSVVEKDEHPIKVTIKGEPDAMMAEGCELIAPVESRVDVD